MTPRARQTPDLPRDARCPSAATDPCRAGADDVTSRRLGHTVAIALGLVALTFAVYGNSLANDFVIDDRIIILNDERVRSGDWRALVSQQYWPGGAGNALYRPLPMLTFALTAAVSTDPVAFRVPNLLLHALAAFALYLLARDTSGDALVGAASAILFVVHPIHTAPLNAIVDRAELLAACFGLFGLWLYWRDAAPDARPSRARPLTAAVCVALALFSKESAAGTGLLALVVAPLLCMRGWPAGARDRATRWFVRTALPLTLAMVAYLAARHAALGELTRDPQRVACVDNPLAFYTQQTEPPPDATRVRVFTPLAIFGLGARKLVWPWPLSWDYSYAAVDVARGPFQIDVLTGAAAFAALVTLAVASWRRRGTAVLGVALLLLPYLPVSNTFVLIGTLFAERFLYTPSAGFCLLVGLGASAAWIAVRSPSARGSSTPEAPQPSLTATRRVAAGAALIALAGAFVAGPVATVGRNRDWRSDAVLNAADLRAQPRSARLWTAVATDALNARQFQAAIAHAAQARTIDPTYPTPLRVAGLAHWQLAQVNDAFEALTTYERLGGERDEPLAVALADLYQARHETAAALKILRDFVHAQPRAAHARNNLAWLLLTAEPADLRDPAQAVIFARQAVALAPGAGDYVDTYIEALLTADRRAEARRELDRLIPTLSPRDPYRESLVKKRAAL